MGVEGNRVALDRLGQNVIQRRQNFPRLGVVAVCELLGLFFVATRAASMPPFPGRSSNVFLNWMKDGSRAVYLKHADEFHRRHE